MNKLFDPSESRLTVFPIQFPEIWNFRNKQMSVFWTINEIDFSKDKTDWDKLTSDEQYFMKYILSFFGSSDKIVNMNIEKRFIDAVTIYEVEMNYNWQKMMEDIHAETYSVMLDTYIKDKKELNKVFNALEHFPAIKEKADWALKWIDNDDATYCERLIAFACVEGIFFSGSFCAIYYFKKRGLLPGLCFANELISRDEGLHTDFAILLYKTFIKGTSEDISEDRIRRIFQSAVDIEENFIINAIPCRLIGMNSDLMRDYIKYIADRLLQQFGFAKMWHISNPFDWMESISLQGKSNFFEKRVGEYTIAKNDHGKLDLEDDDF